MAARCSAVSDVEGDRNCGSVALAVRGRAREDARSGKLANADECEDEDEDEDEDSGTGLLVCASALTPEP